MQAYDFRLKLQRPQFRLVQWSQMKIPKQIQTEGRGEPAEHLNTSETSFIQRESFPYHQDHNIQSFLGLPQTIQKRSLQFINTHFWGNVYLYTRS